MAKTKRRKCHICGKLFVPKYDSKTKAQEIEQKICSCKCAVPFYEMTKPKGRKARAYAKIVAKMVGRRSMGEVQFDANYIEGRGVFAVYEANTFEYCVSEKRKYTPDWIIITKTSEFFIEYKGVLDGRTRKKMKLVKQQNPELDIRFIFQNASNKISKASKTTYGDWATQWGFKWADNRLPKEWLKE
jgi:hypothetical protein